MSDSQSARARKRGLWITLVVFLLVADIAIAMIVGSRPPETSITQEAPVLMQVPVEVHREQPTVLVLTYLGVTVYVPAGALPSDGALSLAPREPNLFPEASDDSDWRRPRIVNLQFFDDVGRMIPDVVLAREIKVCFTLDKHEWHAFLTYPPRYDVQVYEETLEPPLWVPLPEVIAADRQLCGRLSHLTLVALATRWGAPEPTPDYLEGIYGLDLYGND